MRVPNLRSWFWMGRTQPWEFIITLRLPWRRLLYDISSDQLYVGHPRLSFRLRWGVTIDEYMPKRLVKMGGLPERFNA